jgi:hypothetical protein
MLSRFMKFKRCELSEGVSTTCAGVDDTFEFLELWWYFHKVLDLSEFEVELKYFSDLPTIAEYEGFTL